MSVILQFIINNTHDNNNKLRVSNDENNYSIRQSIELVSPLESTNYADETYPDISFTPSLSMKIECKLTNNIIIAPGLYNFIGERYILLRSKEIEDNMYNSRTFENSDNEPITTLGIAKFKLGVFGYRDERFDFTRIPIQEFHPI